MNLRVVTVLVTMILLALAPAVALEIPTNANFPDVPSELQEFVYSGDERNWSAVEEYGKLLELGRASIDKKPNWEATFNLNESSDYVTPDGYYVAQFSIIRIGASVNPFAHHTPDFVVIYNLETKEQIDLTWEQFQDAKEYEEYNRG